MHRVFGGLFVFFALLNYVSAQGDKSVDSAAANGEVRNLSRNQPDSPAFQHFTDGDGIPIVGVSCFFQDGRGFLWVGTFFGLKRFDGYQFAGYVNDVADQTSISHNNITAIYETKSGQLWFGTADGLNRYDQALNSFKSYKFAVKDSTDLKDSYVRTIFEDGGGTLWIGTNGGLSKFDAAAESFTNYQFPTSGSNVITNIVEDKNGGLWVGTNDGLHKFDRNTGNIQSFRFNPQNPNSLSSSLIWSMIIDRAGFLWIGTNDGLDKFDPKTEQFTRYTADKNKPNSLNDAVVRAVYQTKSGTIWAGTNGGLHRYSEETNDFAVYKHDPANPRSLSEGEILSVFEDNNEQLWVGGADGLNKFNQKTNRFLRFRHDVNNPNSIGRDEILSIFEDSRKILWIGTRRIGKLGELNKYDIERKRFEIVKDFGDALVYSIYEDRRGKLWFGTFDGLISFDRETNRITRYQGQAADKQENAVSTSVITIRENREGKLLLGTIGGGMGIFDPDSGKFTSFEYDPNNAENSGKNRVYATFEDRDGQLWIGTGDGLNKFNLATGGLTHFSRDSNNPNSLSASDVGTIYEDGGGTLWIGTTSGGLNRFDRATETFTHFMQRDGLPSNDVFEIMEDAQGNLWLCTDRGLARFNIETGSVRNFNVSDGVPNNPFDNKTAFKNRDGAMYFGGQDGFVRFNPKDFTDSNFKPPVVLTDIRVLEQPLKTARNIAETKELNLSWQDYVVSFDFAALDFTDPKKLQYQWRLEGFDRDWINGGTRRTATYTNLPGGEYVLRVKATNVDGVWTEESLNLKITVTPPFYRTVWFLALVSLTISGLIGLLYRSRINQLRRISEAQTRFTQQLITSQEAERKRIAAELHDGLGQNLVVIKNRAMLGINKGDDKVRVAKELNSISESASQALEEVREITNNLRPQLLDRLGLTKAINAMLKKVSGVIEIESEIDSIDNVFSEIEEISVYRIVQESLNNIIKHSNASDAKVLIKRNENKVLITIADNGKGFDPANAKSNGGGFGLVGLKERAQLLNGEFLIESKIGEGTKIKLELRLQA